MSQMVTNDAHWDDVVHFLNRYQSFLIVSHVNPDGDAVSSTVAMAHILDRLGKAYTMTNDNVIPDKYRFLKLADTIQPWEQAKSASFEAIITVDCADRERLGTVEELLERRLPLLNIDHHPTNDQFGDVNLVLSERAATAEVIYLLASYMQLDWDRDFAEAVYMGMMTDTGCFRFSNTTADVMSAAAHLLTYGVIPNKVAEPIYENITMPQLLILKDALNSLSVTPDGKIAWIQVTVDQMNQANAKEEDVGGIVNFARNIEGVEVGILFKQVDNNTVKVSLRSREHVNVSHVAQQFGGGGHVRAAGCTIEDTIEGAVEAVLSVTRRVLS